MGGLSFTKKCVYLTILRVVNATVSRFSAACMEVRIFPPHHTLASSANTQTRTHTFFSYTLCSSLLSANPVHQQNPL